MGTPAYLAPEVIAAQPGKSYDAQVKEGARWGGVAVPVSSLVVVQGQHLACGS